MSSGYNLGTSVLLSNEPHCKTRKEFSSVVAPGVWRIQLGLRVLNAITDAPSTCPGPRSNTPPPGIKVDPCCQRIERTTANGNACPDVTLCVENTMSGPATLRNVTGYRTPFVCTNTV